MPLVLDPEQARPRHEPADRDVDEAAEQDRRGDPAEDRRPERPVPVAVQPDDQRRAGQEVFVALQLPPVEPLTW